MKGVKPSVDLVDADTGEVVVEAGKKLTARTAKQLADKGLKALKVTDEDLVGQYVAEDHRQPLDGRDLSRGRRRALGEEPQGAGRCGLRRDPRPRHRPCHGRRLYPQHARRRQERVAARRRSSTSTASCVRASRRRSTRPKSMFQSLFFDSERYDLSAVGRVKMNMRLDLDAEDTVRILRKDDILAVVQHAGRPARRQGRDRRHRPSRQSPRALGRRAHGEPVSRRPPAHGARDQGAHVVGRRRHRDAAGPDQRQAGGRGRARVLRLLAALPVHGPDEPALGDHPQAPPLGALGRAA